MAMDSILTSIKKLLNIAENYTHFDEDIIIHINSAFMILEQLGVGPANAFAITGKTETWEDFYGVDLSRTPPQSVKVYIFLKVKMAFDPPQTAHLISAIDRQVEQLEWRMNVREDKTEVIVNE